MNKYIASLIIALCCFSFSFSQDYKTHKVKTGETIESIAKTYLVTPFDIYALNPDAKIDLQPNTVLIIPKSRVTGATQVTQEKTVSGYKKHKVKRKETLFSISQKYNVSIDEIKKHNKRLYSENLRKGDKIQIPEYKTTLVESNVLENTIKKYIVQPKEGKWRIAYKFGITVDELSKLNPKMGDVLQPGDELNVPNIADNEEKAVDEDYGYYTVLPKEGFYRLKIKLGLSQSQLEDLNPELREGGLKAGMVLKVPKDIDVASTISDVELTSLKNNIKNFDEKRLAIMLPFRLHRIDLDSISEVKDQLGKEGYMSISVDFHSGVLMALNKAKEYGISSHLDVYDTQARTSQVSKILSSNDFSDYDAVIGPFTLDNFDRTAESLRSRNVPVFAPVVMPKQLYRNVYQTIPSSDYLRQLILSYVKSDSLQKNVIVISDTKNKAVSDQIKRELGSVKQIFSRKNKKGQEANYILVTDIETEIKPGRNIVFLETANEGFVSNVSSMLNALSTRENEIILMTTNKNKAFEGTNISNIDLSSLKFHFPSVNRNFDSNKTSSFINEYKEIYGSKPNKYATRGYDLTLDILLRLASEDSLDEASKHSIETEYIENKFRYNKKVFGGYYNEAGYIMKYDDLNIVEVKN